MYFQFLVEDKSTEILIRHIMEKIKSLCPSVELLFDIKSFHGIGHLSKQGSIQQQKTGMLLNDLPGIMRGISRALEYMDHAAIIVVLDNDNNDPVSFRKMLEDMAIQNLIMSDHEFCIAIKEMEAWILGDASAIEAAYPNVKKGAMKDYVQDGLCDTWEVLANAVYPGGLASLKKKAARSYSQIGLAKCEWADKIGAKMDFKQNISPSFHFFINSLMSRMENIS